MRVASAHVVFVTLLAPALAGCLDAGAPAANGGPLIDSGPYGQASAVAPQSWSVFPGSYNVTGALSAVLEPGPFGILDPVREVLASAIDGAAIDLSIWRADAPADVPQPILVQASPYFSDTIRLDNWGAFHRDNFVPYGYAYVQLGIRSTGDSGGCDDFRGPNMVADISQAITWLSEQPWTNGNVGLIGISYPGGTPVFAAGSGNPAIKTIVPASGAMDAWETYLRNGTPESRAPVIVAGYGASPFQNPNRSAQHKVENVPCAETYRFWATATGSGVSGERLDPAWWDARNAKPAAEANYRGSVFLVQGLEDWNVDPGTTLPWVDTLVDRGLKVKQLLGQWNHDWPDTGPDETRRLDWAEILLHWYDSELKGLDVDTGPPVQVQDNQMMWRDELRWPPQDLEWTTLHLAGNRELARESGAQGSALLALPMADVPNGPRTPSDVRGVELPSYDLRTDAIDEATASIGAIDFAVAELEESIRIAGLPQAHITVRPTGPAGFLGAWLLDVAPNGTVTRVGSAAMNLRYSEGGRTAQDVTPMEPIVARMEMQPLDALIPAGHSLVLRLWIMPSPERIQSPGSGPMWVDWGGDAESVLHLPVIERGSEVFFEPPRPQPM